MKERLKSKLSSWKGRNLSWAGRATLIKSVAQSIPTYTMAALQFPKKLCDQLDSVGRRFWWNPKRSQVISGLLMLGLLYVDLRRKVVWVLGTFGISIKPFFPN